MLACGRFLVGIRMSNQATTTVITRSLSLLSTTRCVFFVRAIHHHPSVCAFVLFGDAFFERPQTLVDRNRFQPGSIDTTGPHASNPFRSHQRSISRLTTSVGKSWRGDSHRPRPPLSPFLPKSSFFSFPSNLDGLHAYAIIHTKTTVHDTHAVPQIDAQAIPPSCIGQQASQWRMRR